MDIFNGWVGASEGIFWVGGDGWTFLIDQWGEVGVYSGWVAVA